MNRAMAGCLAAMALAMMAQPAASTQRFDRNLEKAAADAFAARAGSIRGTFAPDEKPVMVTAEDIVRKPKPLGAGFDWASAKSEEQKTTRSILLVGNE